MSYNQRGFKWYVVNVQTLAIDSGWASVGDANDRALALREAGASPGGVKVMTKPRVGSLVLDPNDDANWVPKRNNPDGSSGSEEEITGTHRAQRTQRTQRARGAVCPEIGAYVKRRKSAHMYRVIGCDEVEVEVEDVGAGGIERFRVSEFAKLFTDGSNPANVVRTARDERLWEAAKESAAQQGRVEDWPYVMGIFMRMKNRTGGLRENPGELVIVNPSDDALDSARAEEVYEMWHKKPPHNATVLDTGCDGDDEMVCVGNAHDIVYRSGKWESGKKTNDYVHTFSKPEVWMLARLVHVEGLRANPGKTKTLAGLLAQAKNADGQFSVADLARPLSFSLNDGTDEGQDIAIHAGARVYGAVDKKTVIIVDPKWMIIIVKGGRMYFDERGIVH